MAVSILMSSPKDWTGDRRFFSSEAGFVRSLLTCLSNSIGSAEYHPDPEWLERNGRAPIMGEAVEITNTQIFPF